MPEPKSQTNIPHDANSENPKYIRQVAIVGGGLAGLYAAYQLSQMGVDFVLLEAKPFLGGRILALKNVNAGEKKLAGKLAGKQNEGNPLAQDKAAANIKAKANNTLHDLGPTWIFEHQTKMQALAKELGLSLFEQYIQGDALYQLANTNQARRIEGAGSMRMFRVDGGTFRLIEALSASLNPKSLMLDSLVKAYARVPVNSTAQAQASAKSSRKDADLWHLKIDNSEQVIIAEHVFLAIPPRIVARDFINQTNQNILSQSLLKSLQGAQTWMAAQAKFVVTYTRAFWREQGLSGQSFSQVGPMIEMHDASLQNNGDYALFGFIGIPATRRRDIDQDTLQAACLHQLAFFYGDAVYEYSSAGIKDWANDDFICTAQDIAEGSKHPMLNLTPFKAELESLNLHLIGSEFAQAGSDPGYLEGAINAVDSALASWIKVHK